MGAPVAEWAPTWHSWSGWPAAGVGVDSDQSLGQQRGRVGGGSQATSFIGQMFLESPETEWIGNHAIMSPGTCGEADH